MNSAMSKTLDSRFPATYRLPVIPLSSNGKTTDSDSVNCGSNPHGGSSLCRTGSCSERFISHCKMQIDPVLDARALRFDGTNLGGNRRGLGI